VEELLKVRVELIPELETSLDSSEVREMTEQLRQQMVRKTKNSVDECFRLEVNAKMLMLERNMMSEEPEAFLK